jgi:hypothetical protein
MNPDEAERHLMNGSRAAKLAIHAANGAAGTDRIELPGGFWSRRHFSSHPDNPWYPRDPMQFGAIGDHSFEVLVTVGGKIKSITLPYGVVKEAWVGNSGQVAILLSVRLTSHQGTDEGLTRVTMDPLR